MKIFRAFTALLIACLLVSALLHIVLLMSDSPEYRTWVYIQISLHVLGAWLLWHARKFRLIALLGFAVLSLPLVYINATYLNYGNGPNLWLAPLLFWCAYGSLAAFAWRGSTSRSMSSGT
ncbi:MAG: hypothetical protein V4673_00925 [Pseudomonadota bacterium]